MQENKKDGTEHAGVKRARTAGVGSSIAGPLQGSDTLGNSQGGEAEAANPWPAAPKKGALGDTVRSKPKDKGRRKQNGKSSPTPAATRTKTGGATPRAASATIDPEIDDSRRAAGPAATAPTKESRACKRRPGPAAKAGTGEMVGSLDTWLNGTAVGAKRSGPAAIGEYPYKKPATRRAEPTSMAAPQLQQDAEKTKRPAAPWENKAKKAGRKGSGPAAHDAEADIGHLKPPPTPPPPPTPLPPPPPPCAGGRSVRKRSREDMWEQVSGGRIGDRACVEERASRKRRNGR